MEKSPWQIFLENLLFPSLQIMYNDHNNNIDDKNHDNFNNYIDHDNKKMMIFIINIISIIIVTLTTNFPLWDLPRKYIKFEEENFFQERMNGMGPPQSHAVALCSA